MPSGVDDPRAAFSKPAARLKPRAAGQLAACQTITGWMTSASPSMHRQPRRVEAPLPFAQSAELAGIAEQRGDD